MSNGEMVVFTGPEQKAIGGALEGADKIDRETALWNPSMQSPDKIINSAKQLADARGRDMVQNDGYANGAAALHRDNIVGSQYRLNAQPNYVMLNVSPDWAEEFQKVVEARFNVIAESEDNWLDASRKNTFTGLVRLAVGGFVITGEVLATAEWIRNEPRRPFKTAIQMISPDRLTNPNGMSDDDVWRRGIKRDSRGRSIVASIRKSHPSENYTADSFTWVEVPFEKPWGRKQVIHIIEQLLPDQSRGISDMVAVLKQMRMTKRFQEITLQNAVINASFAAAIESELPDGEVFAAIGAGSTDPMAGLTTYLNGYMGMLGTYLEAAKNINVDGVKIPHLFPGTKLNMQPVGTPGGVGSGFEESLLRHVAAALGLSYEQFSRDYTKTNYSSARASMNETWKFMQSRKKSVADRFANNIYALWLEEEIANGNIPLPPGKNRDWFYEPLVKDALTQCSWIGASRGQIDETKETQAAILRIENNLSTIEEECSRLGKDFRQVFEQRAREKKMMERLGLESVGDPSKAKAGTKTKDKKASGKNNQQSDQQQQNAVTPVKVDLDLKVNHAPIEIKQEPVQVHMSHDAVQVQVSNEPIQIQLEQADVHVHLNHAPEKKMKRVPERDDNGNIVAIREVPDED